ncbi:Rap1a/Tai family immunity protein [Comamonas thiooxydans]|uniref:Rap1a/Tai family immunity protein n=1 Tax=Comamonas thiooxydans TaxID=363952 RepID=A0AA42Q7G8_9BURK|nr:Rap1a/Tai family immunity protein [Comamonas thiooxydans]MDH1337499.1 Rap1a/Tai family immunity protein [Comamonas thiooxydans]MDH1743668.1 Rap1a/Tai family immunity protein [Comamonas thiooxydans]MDH1789978.1 Rap1a/Tai family immunity protein [Comamonas thiooxydans]
MRALLRAAALLVAVLFVPHLHAQEITGNELHQWLSETKKSQAGIASDRQLANIARGYTLGVSETLAASKIICIPDGVTRGQILDIIFMMLDTKPQLRHMNANPLVAVALQDVFPCKPR